MITNYPKALPSKFAIALSNFANGERSVGIQYPGQFQPMHRLGLGRRFPQPMHPTYAVWAPYFVRRRSCPVTVSFQKPKRPPPDGQPIIWCAYHGPGAPEAILPPARSMLYALL